MSYAVAVVGVLVLSFALLSSFGFVPASFAADTCTSTVCSVSVSPSSGATGSQFSITMTFSPPSTGQPANQLIFVAVVTPTGSEFVCANVGGSPCAGVFTEGAGQSGTCTIPFGQSGTFGGADSGCAPSISNSNAWAPQPGAAGMSSQDITDLETGCTTGSAPTSTVDSGVGSTSATGTYTVIACFTNPITGVGGLYASTTFSVAVPTPEFPLGLALAILTPLAALGAFAYFRARRSKGTLSPTAIGLP